MDLSHSEPQPPMAAAAASTHSNDAAVQIGSLYQAQKKIYLHSVTGRFVNWRWAPVWITQFTSISLRSQFKVDIVRDRATLARQVEDGEVECVYRLLNMNATQSLAVTPPRQSGCPRRCVFRRRPRRTPHPACTRSTSPSSARRRLHEMPIFVLPR